MRIALITREYPPETSWGGIGSFYRQLANALLAAGHEVEVFAQGIHREHTEQVEGVMVHRVLARREIFGEPAAGDTAGNRDLGNFAYALAEAFLHAFLRRHQEKPFEIVEGHEHLGVNALVNLHAPENTITVTRYHTSYHSLVSRKLVDWPISPRIVALEKLGLSHAHYRISTSHFIDAITRSDFALPEPAPVLANFVAQPPPPPTGSTLARENLIAFAGRLVLEHKRPDLAAQAFARVAAEFGDWRIEFAGLDQTLPDGRTTWQLCSDQLASLPRSRYHYHGVMDAAGMDTLYRRARILIVPSQFESFGMVAIEAMHRGCVPLVASETALTDAVDHPDLIFKNGDLDELTAKLRQLMQDEGLWSARSTACQQRAAGVFDANYLFKQNLYFFDSIKQARRVQPSSNHAPAVAAPPRFSIVTPSYNQGKYIEETVASVLYQDYPDFEHVVMDAGSTDGTLPILRKYPHLRWRSESDQGQAHAINKGLLATTGEIVAYLNSDDVYRAGTFQAVAKIFQDEPETQIVVGHCDVIDGNSTIIGHHRAKEGGLAELVQYWGWDRLHCIPQQSVFFRRALLAELGLFEVRFHMVMDYQFWLRVVASGRRFRVIDRTLAAFRIVPTTKTGGRTTEMYLEEYAASREFWPLLPTALRIKVALGARRQVARKMLDVAEHLLLQTSQGRRPLEFLRVACRYWPPAIFGGRFLLTLIGATIKGPHALSTQLTRLHLGYLARLWRRRQKSPTS